MGTNYEHLTAEERATLMVMRGGFVVGASPCRQYCRSSARSSLSKALSEASPLYSIRLQPSFPILGQGCSVRAPQVQDHAEIASLFRERAYVGRNIFRFTPGKRQVHPWVGIKNGKCKQFRIGAKLSCD
jgi:hypothetical protein